MHGIKLKKTSVSKQAHNKPFFFCFITITLQLVFVNGTDKNIVTDFDLSFHASFTRLQKTPHHKVLNYTAHGLT